MRLAACIAVLGTGSDVGKSIVTTALCRCFADRQLRVAPFKAQNMSNNAGVTPEGREMGRAQIIQAEAARIPPHVDMNPILQKPNSQLGAQVILRGRSGYNRQAGGNCGDQERFFRIACGALDRLRRKHDMVVMEGAGSCAEVNLAAQDFVNFRMAEYVDAPVILVADIHRGGVFAQIVGTLECLPGHRRDRIAGFIINRFRGDHALFKDGIEWIQERTGKDVFGVLPWYDHFTIGAEDAVVLEASYDTGCIDPSVVGIGVIRLPHISNFTDFDPLMRVRQLAVHYLSRVQSLAPFRAVILPGSKNTRSDLDWLYQTGWAREIKAFVARGGFITGICGGYQMMGESIHDPQGLEGPAGSSPGLGLLPVETVLESPKTTTLTRFTWQGVEGWGYEIHMGRTTRKKDLPLFCVQARNQTTCRCHDGCAVDDHRIMGTYLHGIFDTPAITRLWLAKMGLDHLDVPESQGLSARNGAYDLLAEHFSRHVDLTRMMERIGAMEAAQKGRLVGNGV